MITKWSRLDTSTDNQNNQKVDGTKVKHRRCKTGASATNQINMAGYSGGPNRGPYYGGGSIRDVGPSYRFQVTGLDEKWTNFLVEKVRARFGAEYGVVKKDSVLDPKTTHLIVGHRRR